MNVAEYWFPIAPLFDNESVYSRGFDEVAAAVTVVKGIVVGCEVGAVVSTVDNTTIGSTVPFEYSMDLALVPMLAALS